MAAEKGFLTKAAITELKSLASPPQQVKDMATAVVIVLGDYHVNEDTPPSRVQLSEGSFRTFKKTISYPDFLNRVKNFDPKTLTPHQVKWAKTVTEQMTVDEIRKKSAAAAGLLHWVQMALNEAEGSA